MKLQAINQQTNQPISNSKKKNVNFKSVYRFDFNPATKEILGQGSYSKTVAGTQTMADCITSFVLNTLLNSNIKRTRGSIVENLVFTEDRSIGYKGPKWRIFKSKLTDNSLYIFTNRDTSRSYNKTRLKQLLKDVEPKNIVPVARFEDASNGLQKILHDLGIKGVKIDLVEWKEWVNTIKKAQIPQFYHE